MNEFAQALASLIAITNPVTAAPVFLTIVSGLSLVEKRRAAAQAAITVLAILLIAALTGNGLLQLFGISIDAFRSAGGLVIIIVGLEMLRGQANPVQEEKATKYAAADKIFVPFAMPLVAGPAAITAVITLSANGKSVANFPWQAIIGSVLCAAILWLVLYIASARERLLSPRGERLFTRFMGLILVAVGFQIGLTGLKAFFNT